MDAWTRLDEGEVADELASVAPVAGQDAAVVRRDIDRQGRESARGVRDGGRLRRDAGERADSLAVAVEVE